MNAVILACSSLIRHVNAAQKKMRTCYPIIALDRKYHADPSQMREQIIAAAEKADPEADTILVAMGFCGGSWNAVPLEKRVVIPRVDDCITLLLHTDESCHPNLKQPGHFYLRDSDSGAYSLEAMQQNLCDRHGREQGLATFHSWFAGYTDVDIIDTGEYDCYSESYMAEAQKNADLVHCRLNHVAGSNMLLEKLVSGNWDQQFLVAEPGQMFSSKDFLL